jgi:hypothetical protein
MFLINQPHPMQNFDEGGKSDKFNGQKQKPTIIFLSLACPVTFCVGKTLVQSSLANQHILRTLGFVWVNKLYDNN